MEESIDSMARRAELRKTDDRKEYALKMKYGKRYKDFMDKAKDDREEYKKRMKGG